MPNSTIGTVTFRLPDHNHVVVTSIGFSVTPAWQILRPNRIVFNGYNNF